MDNIISIDLDILMSPYIGIYNDQIHSDMDRLYNWSNISRDINIDQFFINEKYKKQVVDIINRYKNSVDKIYVGYDHSSILTAMQAVGIYNRFDLYNIDYHHDISYSVQDEDAIIEQHITNCGSWVGFLNKFYFLNSYKWYCGVGSQFSKVGLSGKATTPKNIDIYQFGECNFPMDLENVKILYIALSPPWIPPQLFEDMKKIVLDNIDRGDIVYLEGPFNLNNDAQNIIL